MGYQIREKVAYSKLGKLVATMARDLYFPSAKVHWIQQAFADWSVVGLGVIHG